MPRVSASKNEAARELGSDTSQIIRDRDKWPSYVEHGSQAHAHLLGIEENGDPQQQAALRQALATAPEPSAPVSKVPVSPHNYANGEEVKFGFVIRTHRGRRTR